MFADVEHSGTQHPLIQISGGVYNSTVPFDRELIEAQLALELIANADMPKIVWDAWDAGLDGPAMRRLGSLYRPTYFQVREVLPKALEEMCLKEISKEEAALRIAKHLAADILASASDPVPRVREFESLWSRAGYPHSIAALGTLYDDLYIWSLSDAREREYAVSLLRGFLDQ